MKSVFTRRAAVGLGRMVWVGIFLTCALRAQVAFNLTLEGFDGASNPTTPDLPAAVRANAQAGLMEWGRWLAPAGPRSIEVVVRVDARVPRGGGASVTSAFVNRAGDLDLFEEGVAHEIRTGEDPNGAEPDAVITLNPAYLRDELWFDPDPSARQATVPLNRLDALGFFAHEFGHVLGFNGWGTTATGAFPGNYRSRFDFASRWDGSNWYFEGPTARALLGAPVPLSRIANTYHHYGNPADSNAPGQEPFLIAGLMNGVVFQYGQRYAVGLLDLAFLQDLALPLGTGVSFAAPVPTLRWSPSGKPLLRWPTAPLAQYLVETSEFLHGPWDRLSDGPFASSAQGTFELEDATPLGAARFYRVVLRP